MRRVNRSRLEAEYSRLLEGLAATGAIDRSSGGEEWLANPALPEDIVREAVPGEMRRVLSQSFIFWQEANNSQLLEGLAATGAIALLQWRRGVAS